MITNETNQRTRALDQLNKILGLLITIRTVESDKTGRNWTDYPIDDISKIRNALSRGVYDCSKCSIKPVLGKGSKCGFCDGRGFVITEHDWTSVFSLLEKVTGKKYPSLESELSEFISVFY